ncbi:hypothetical protein BDFB_006825, partial [Asbolus verrucosus]
VYQISMTSPDAQMECHLRRENRLRSVCRTNPIVTTFQMNSFSVPYLGCYGSKPYHRYHKHLVVPKQ